MEQRREERGWSSVRFPRQRGGTQSPGRRAPLAPGAAPLEGSPGREVLMTPGSRGSLTLDFSCPRLGGTKPARSRERRQDARRSRAMAGCSVSGSPQTLWDPGPPSVWGVPSSQPPFKPLAMANPGPGWGPRSQSQGDWNFRGKSCPPLRSPPPQARRDGDFSESGQR